MVSKTATSNLNKCLHFTLYILRFISFFKHRFLYFLFRTLNVIYTYPHPYPHFLSI